MRSTKRSGTSSRNPRANKRTHAAPSLPGVHTAPGADLRAYLPFSLHFHANRTTPARTPLHFIIDRGIFFIIEGKPERKSDDYYHIQGKGVQRFLVGGHIIDHDVPLPGNRQHHHRRQPVSPGSRWQSLRGVTGATAGFPLSPAPDSPRSPAPRPSIPESLPRPARVSAPPGTRRTRSILPSPRVYNTRDDPRNPDCRGRARPSSALPG